MTTEKREIDMLHGSLWDKILWFTLPLAATSILQQLFNSADVAVVGRFVGSDALAAAGANGPVINLIVGSFVGLSVGANAVISTLIGQGREDRIHKAVHTSIMMALVIGIIMGACGILVARPLLGIMGTPDNIMDKAVIYLKIYMSGMPFILIYNFASAILRARGDTRRPLIALCAAGVINVLLNLFFVIVLRMNIEGVAIATVISNIISSMLLVVFLTKEKSSVKFSLHDMKIDSYSFTEICKIGVPAGLQGAVFSISNVFIQAAMNSLGSATVAASSVALNYEMITFYIVSSFGQAAVTFIGQNYGAGNWDRCMKTIKWCLIHGAIFALSIDIICMIFRRPFAGIFTSDSAVIDIAIIRMETVLMFEVFNMVIEVMSGSLRGLGYSLAPALVCMVGACGIRLIWIYTVFAHMKTFDVLLRAYSISWIITSAVLVMIFFIIKNRSKQMIRKQSI